MSAIELTLILFAGVGAGMINVIVGSGSLITFPTLLFFGVPPVVANMSNNVGLLPGGLAGSWGYRRELGSIAYWAKRLVPASVAGGAIGAGLLLVLPAAVFEAVVPLLVALGVLLVIVGPWLQRRTGARREQDSAGAGVTPGGPSPEGGTGASASAHPVLLIAAVFLTGVYGGYFGAAQGVILVGVLGVLLAAPLQQLNAVKNVLGLAANAVAAGVFIAARGAEIDWAIAATIGVGTLIGGLLGARVGRTLPPLVLRSVIVAIGLVAIAYLLLT